MQEKRITFVLGGLVGGGAERVATALIKEWYLRGFKITLITRLGPEQDFFQIPDDLERIILGGEGQSKNKIAALFKNIPFVWKLRKAIHKAGNPVVISFLTKTNIHTLLAGMGLGKQIIISERSDTTRQTHPWPWPQLRKTLYKYSKFVTANSDIAIQGMKPYVPVEKLIYVPNPVSVPEVKSTPESCHEILNVGRLVLLKRQDLLLQAFSKLSETLKNKWSCSFLGEGEELETLNSISKSLRISDRITFHGQVKNPSDYYLKAGIFVLTSEFEGTPNVLLEAMAHGLPAIIPDCLPGALKYINHGENGLVFKTGDPDDLCLKLTELMENPRLRSEMGKRAVKSVEHLTIEKITEEWEKLFTR